MSPLEKFSERLGHYDVTYIRIPTLRLGVMVYVYRARLRPGAPCQLPKQKCGAKNTLGEARGAVREWIPPDPWSLEDCGAETPTKEA